MKKSIINNFTHWKGKATGRKGMGMELALLVLFVVFACSVLLVSSAMLGKSNLNDRKDQMAERFALDQLAEQAMADTNFVNNNENYRVEKRDDSLVIADPEGTVLLTVAWEDGKITRWEYQ